MHVQCVIQMRRSVYSPIYYPVKAPWYPIRLPTGQYIYPFPCIALFMITLRCLSYLKKQPKPSIYIHFSKSYIGLHFLQNFRQRLYTFLARPCLCDSYFACLIAAISVFTTSTISKVVLNDTKMVTYRATYLKPIWLTLIYVTSSYRYFLLCHESPSILSKIKKKCLTQILFDRHLVKWRPS